MYPAGYVLDTHLEFSRHVLTEWSRAFCIKKEEL